MERGADFFEKEKEKKRQQALDGALARAVANRDAKEARSLLTQGASVSAPSSDGGSLLMQMIRAIGLHRSGPKERAREVFDLLLSFGADVSQMSDGGQNALHLASFFGQAELVQSVLAHGGRVNEADFKWCSAAHWVGASADTDEEGRAGTLATVRVLGEAGANFRAKNNSGETPVERARARGDENVALEMEGIEALRESRLISEDLPSKSRERKASL